MPLTTTISTQTLLYTAVAATATTLLLTSISLLSPQKSIPNPHSRTTIPSPRTTLLPHLSKSQIDGLGYPPDALPGARDVSTPYGFVRVYEWGPTEGDGRRVVLVHGDSTPAPIFARVAERLVRSGCRVLMFDLWGRGYTDTPSQIHHDSRLYGLQILYAINSSPVPWTGVTETGLRRRFSIVGFSMGGPISLDFFADQPQLVESMVLLAPAGLLPSLPPEYQSFFFRRPGLVSKARMRRLIGTLLGVDLSPLPSGGLRQRECRPLNNDDKEEPIAKGFTPAAASQFQFDHHQGHVESILSTVQYGPYQHQEAVWEKACRIIRGEGDPAVLDTPLHNGRILVMCGRDDGIITAKNVQADLIKYLAEPGLSGDKQEESARKHHVFKTVPGGHGFLWDEGEKVGELIAEFWGI